MVGSSPWRVEQASCGVVEVASVIACLSNPLNLLPNQPIVGIRSTDDDRGYLMVVDDGDIFAFGDAPFLGSRPGPSGLGGAVA